MAASNTRGGGPLGLVGMLSIAVVGYAVVFGPQLARNDLRRDLEHLATLKAWPLRGAVIVRGEVLAPALLLSCRGLGVYCGRAGALIQPAVCGEVGWPDRMSFAAGGGAAGAWPDPDAGRAAQRDRPDVPGVGSGPKQPRRRRRRSAPRHDGRVDARAGSRVRAGGARRGPRRLAIRQAIGMVPVVVPAAVALVVLVIECGIATETLGGLFERTDIGALTAVGRAQRLFGTNACSSNSLSKPGVVPPPLA